ncbi:MAG: VOC family protein [Actinobacteria bacterium]|nr:VOC family protein [Actinomycetota bacterium]
MQHLPDLGRFDGKLNPEDQQAEVERLKKLGAAEADIGQGGEVTWIVLAHPEGNEFCILTPRST